MRNLGLKTTRFNSVFNNVTEPAWGRSITSNMEETVADRSSNSGQSLMTGEVELGVAVRHNPRAQSDRLGPVLTDYAGHRTDRLLQVNKVVMERIRKGHLCHYFYLRGSCAISCWRNHLHRPLTDEEFDALWEQARQGRCAKSRKAERVGGDDCSDVMCIYGHGRQVGYEREFI